MARVRTSRRAADVGRGVRRRKIAVAYWAAVAAVSVATIAIVGNDRSPGPSSTERPGEVAAAAPSALAGRIESGYRAIAIPDTMAVPLELGDCVDLYAPDLHGEATVLVERAVVVHANDPVLVAVPTDRVGAVLSARAGSVLWLVVSGAERP